MKKIASLVLVTLSVFFIVGCDRTTDKEELILPALEIVGDSIMEVEQYSTFVDPGVGIIGEFDLDVVVDSNVDTSMVGDYTITYTITYLEIEYEVSRTVRVVELGTAITPGIQLTGAAVVEVVQYSTFVDPGVELLGGLDLDVVTESNVDTNTIGSYTITYTITYLTIEYVATRTVNVVADTTGTLPSLELVGDAVIVIEKYLTFIDPGAIVNGDFDLEISVDSDVDTSLVGDYIITYSILYMEVEYSITRTVKVIDNTLIIFPSIELVGDERMEVIQYTEFVDPGFTIIGDVALDVVTSSPVDTNTLGEYTIIYSYMYESLYYSISRVVVVVEAPALYELSLELVGKTEDSITVDFNYVDDNGYLSDTMISIYQGDVLVESYSMKAEHANVEFTDLDPNTMYFIEITGTYLVDDVPTEITGYFLNVRTNEVIDLSFIIVDPFTSVDLIDFAIQVNDPNDILTDLVAHVYQGELLVRTIEIFDGIMVGEVEENVAMAWVRIDGLDVDTEYHVELEYTYNSPGSTGEVTMQLDKVAYRTLAFFMPPVLSNECNERYYALYCEIDIDFTDYNQYYYVIAKLYEDGIFKKQVTLTDDASLYEFLYLTDDTDYTIEIYADYTHSASGGYFNAVLIGTFEAKTLLSGSLTSPTIENIVITNTDHSITVDFDFIDNELAMERGFVYLERGWSNLASEAIVVGHNTIVFDEYIDENTLYSILIKVDDTGNSSFDTYHEEDVFIPPVITMVSFEPTEMFFLGDDVVMKLVIDNDEEYDITAVTIEGGRYETFKFPSGTEELYINLGVKLVATYPITLQNIIITHGEVGSEEEIVLDVTATTDVTVYPVGSVDPDDATVAVIDIIPQEYISPEDKDNSNFRSTVVTDVYLDNKYNLPVTSLKIGGIEYTGADITVISSTHIQVTVGFQYGSPTSSNNNLFFSHIKFERNGEEITGLVGANAKSSIYVYEIGGTSPTQFTYINTVADFLAMETGNDQVGIFVLNADLDFTGVDYTPIGTYENKFTGTFLGNGHTISNITINKTFAASNQLNHVGIFGYSAASIRDLYLDNINITVNTTEDNELYVGTLAGVAYGGFSDVHITNSSIVINGMVKGNVGGLIGQSYHYQITNLYRTSTDTDITITTLNASVINSRLYVGGLVGHQTQGVVRHSSATGDIFVAFGFSQNIAAGGLLGGGGEYVANSYATGDVTVTANGYSRVGGLIGDGGGDVVNCYASGDVTSTYGKVGGLIGETDGFITSSFAIGTVTRDGYDTGLLLGIGNYIKLDRVYGYDATIDYVVTYYLYDNSIIPGSLEYNDSEYYLDFLGWSTHFYNFSTLDVENKVLPIH